MGIPQRSIFEWIFAELKSSIEFDKCFVVVESCGAHVNIGTEIWISVKI